MLDKKRICNCGHNIDWHRFLKLAKPSACLFIFKNSKNKEFDCNCDKFEEIKNGE